MIHKRTLKHYDDKLSINTRPFFGLTFCGRNNTIVRPSVRPSVYHNANSTKRYAGIASVLFIVFY